MGVSLLGWVLAALATATAGAFGLLARAQRGARSRLEAELGETQRALEAQRGEQAKRARSFEERGKELGELRRRLDKTRRRAFDARATSGSLEERIAELEQALERRDEQARASARALEAAREALAARDRELVQAREQLADAATAPDPAEDGARRHQMLEAELRDLTRKLRDAERETARYRSRERTHRRLYLVIKGELDAARDRLAALGSPVAPASHPDTGREQGPPEEGPVAGGV